MPDRAACSQTSSPNPLCSCSRPCQCPTGARGSFLEACTGHNSHARAWSGLVIIVCWMCWHIFAVLFFIRSVLPLYRGQRPLTACAGWLQCWHTQVPALSPYWPEPTVIHNLAWDKHLNVYRTPEAVVIDQVHVGAELTPHNSRAQAKSRAHKYNIYLNGCVEKFADWLKAININFPLGIPSFVRLNLSYNRIDMSLIGCW